ncbi:hypothetical protein FRB90_009031 [Tulasnella sp. 427]|nr:hypothetical protein FRB90_009031 [Tulasnella sp. 427]
MDSIVMRDRETGRSRGFGFVTYQTDAEAQTAIASMNEQDLDGRRVKVNLANARGGGGNTGAYGAGGGFPQQSYGGYGQQYGQGFQQPQQQPNYGQGYGFNPAAGGNQYGQSMGGGQYPPQPTRTPNNAPPSSYGRRATTSYGTNGGLSASEKASRRTSRIDMDFEQALKAGGTVVLEEGRRLESLGLTSTPSATSSRPSSSSGSRQQQRPPTPKIVPPTPESSFQRSSPVERQRTASSSTPSSSEKSKGPVQSESASAGAAGAAAPLAPSPTIVGATPFPEVNEPVASSDVQTKRRSLFRTSGTASSPDLAALMRKAKERGGTGADPSASSAAAARQIQQQQQQDSSSTQNHHLSPPIVLNGQPPSSTNPLLSSNQSAQDQHARQRTRSSTSSSFSVISSPSVSDAPPQPTAAHVKNRGKMAKAEKVLGVSGQGIGSHSAFENSWSQTERAPKQSIRSKTSALWGKVTGTTRARGLSSASSTVPNTPITPNSSYNPFTQQGATPSFSVSPPPPGHTARSPYASRSTTLRDDLFNSPKAASSTNLTKPLPPIYQATFRDDDDGRGTLRPGKGKGKSTTAPPVVVSRGNRRRSMSVDAVDLKQILAMGGRISQDINLDKAHPALPPAVTTAAPATNAADLESTDGHSLLSGWNLASTGGLDDFRGSFAGLTGPPSSSDDHHHSKTKPMRLRTTDLTPPELVPPGSARSQQSSSMPSTPYLSTNGMTANGSNVSAATAKPPSSSASENESRYSSDVTAMPSESELSASESSKPPTRRGSTRSSPGLPPGAAPPRLYGSSLHAPSDGSRPNAMSSSEPSLVPQRSVLARRGSADVASPQQMSGGGFQVSIDSPTPHRTMRVVSSSRQMRMNSDPGSGLEVSIFEYGGDGAVSSPALASEEDVPTRAKSLADRCWREDETFKAREKIAEWLGGSGHVNRLAVQHYMDHFDFKGYRLDNAFRHLCGKLYLKAETQQVDRILEQFGRRYWDCNPGNIFGNPSVVHSVAYSLLLLNTDLHIAELTSHMSRGQFVRNTLYAVTESARSSSPTSSSQPSMNPAARASTPDLPSHSEEVSRRQSGESSDPSTLRMKSKRSGSITSWKSGSREAVGGMLGNASTPALLSSPANQSSGANTPNDSTRPSPTNTTRSPPVFTRSWELEMENLLKDMYTAIKDRQILQPTSSMERSSMSSLTPGSTLVGRSRSQRRNGGTNALKRGSIRGIQTLLGSQSPYSSTSSSTDGRVSPSPSFATSFGDAVSASSSSLFAPTLGFASNLSHTIIKEAQEDDVHSIDSVDTADTSVSITDEELALQGAPWAKEGMLCRKQYWESTGKRAKDKSWSDVFVVIQKGTLNMFTFGEMSAASRGGGVGGGNWLANATPMGTVNLAHSLAHVLPPPGYNRSRPHCFVLTLSTDAVFFFQAGTEDLVNEWVSTCNYWAARTSKEPLQGGVSNMEYGWSKVEQMMQTNQLPNNSIDNSDAYSDVFSVRSGRSKISKRSFDVLGSTRANYSPFAMEKIFINDWKAPIPSTVPSTHDEETQMEALQKQVNILKRELAAHDKIQVPMQNMYQPRSPNFMKAMANWEARSKYLLAEVFKYETYVDCLRDAMSLRMKKRGEKVLEKALDSGAEGETFAGLSLRPSRRGLREETIQETEEPLTPGPTSAFSQHTREQATNS